MASSSLASRDRRNDKNKACLHETYSSHKSSRSLMYYADEKDTSHKTIHALVVALKVQRAPDYNERPVECDFCSCSCHIKMNCFLSPESRNIR